MSAIGLGESRAHECHRDAVPEKRGFGRALHHGRRLFLSVETEHGQDDSVLSAAQHTQRRAILSREGDYLHKTRFFISTSKNSGGLRWETAMGVRNSVM